MLAQLSNKRAHVHIFGIFFKFQISTIHPFTHRTDLVCVVTLLCLEASLR